MAQKNLVGIVIALCVGLGVGFITNRALESRMIAGQVVQIEKLQSQIAEAKKFFPPVSQDMRSIFGTVKEVRGDIVTVEIILTNPFDASPQTRMVKITNETTISRNVRKDPAVYQREIAEFQKNVQAQSNKSPTVRLIAPNAFSQQPAKISDIAVGQQISVAANENIRDKESFVGKTVIILPATVTPQSGTPVASTP